ncbi:Pectin acetylesterase 5 [Diplonema papillatum]|nr:Pectin acetylesterase 5 [Diplonema papillatum]
MLANTLVAAVVAGTWQLTLMEEDVSSMGAMCLDGSPGGFYYSAGNAANKNNWLIFFQGGGWCFTEEDCYARANSTLGSSAAWPKTKGPGHGILYQNCTVNPAFCDFNIVYVQYCDGNSFSGNKDAPMVVNGRPLWFRGKRIMDAMLQRLSASFNLSLAEKVVLTGCSAGGLAAYLHTEYVHDWFKAHADGLKVFKTVALSGFFLDHNSVYGQPAYETQIRNIHAMSNASLGGGLNAACVQHYLPSGEDWKCNFAQYTYDFIPTPLFIINSGLDLYQTGCILTGVVPAGFPSGNTTGACGEGSYATCAASPDTECNATEIVALNQYTTDFVTILGNARSAALPGHGAFIHSCHTHCESESANIDVVAVDGVTMRDALSEWWDSVNEPSSMHTYLPCLRKTGNVTNRLCNPTCGTDAMTDHPIWLP